MSEPLRLRVVTFNIHGGRPKFGFANLEATAKVITDLKPDLVSLQEVHCRMPPPYVWQNQPAKLKRLLGMHVTFRRSFGLGPCCYGNAIASRVPPDRIRRTRLPGAYEPRSLLQAEFTLDGHKVRFFNTHLGLKDDERAEQLAVVAREVRQYDLPAIAAGDWNTTPDSGELQVIESTGLQHCADVETPTFPCDEPQCRLDYLMVSRHFEVEDCWVVNTQVSDHRPLVADVVLRQPQDV